MSDDYIVGRIKNTWPCHPSSDNSSVPDITFSHENYFSDDFSKQEKLTYTIGAAATIIRLLKELRDSKKKRTTREYAQSFMLMDDLYEIIENIENDIQERAL